MQLSDFIVIHSYTRSQAIADGMLIDITPMATEAGIALPTVVSANLYHGHVVPPTNTLDLGQSIEGRLWDVVMVFRVYAHRSSSQRVLFPVQFVTGTRQDGSPRNETVQVLGLLHSGDTREPVITIMLPEDE